MLDLKKCYLSVVMSPDPVRLDKISLYNEYASCNTYTLFDSSDTVLQFFRWDTVPQQEELRIAAIAETYEDAIFHYSEAEQLLGKVALIKTVFQESLFLAWEAFRQDPELIKRCAEKGVVPASSLDRRPLTMSIDHQGNPDFFGDLRFDVSLPIHLIGDEKVGDYCCLKIHPQKMGRIGDPQALLEQLQAAVATGDIRSIT